MFLIDTNVVSASAPNRAISQAELADWMDRNSFRLFLSTLTITEIEAGIAGLRRRGGGRRAQDISEWLTELIRSYTDRILPLDVPVARALGVLSDRVRALGHDPGLTDMAIAATAQVHDLTVLTRNKRHFDVLGVAVIDPFEDPPD